MNKPDFSKSATIEDYLEENQQARRFYGKLTLDKICSNCGYILTPEACSSEEPCRKCGEWFSIINEEK